MQAGGGGYARLINALQSLDQAQNIFTLVGQAANFASEIAALQTQVAAQGGYITALQGQVQTLQGQVSTLQGQVTTLQGQVALLQGFMNSFNYLQLEVSTGTYFLDQRTIYRRSFVINGALNTALTNFTYPHGVANINYIVNIQAMAGAATSTQYPITFINMPQAPSLGIGLSCWANATNIYISVGTQAFSGIQVLATMWYTATDR